MFNICMYKEDLALNNSAVTQQKVIEWEITKTEVGNEMEIFITLTKYNTYQWREEGNPLLMVTI